MKASINSENKAKFFAQYWGQRIWRTPVNYDVSIRIAGLIDLEKSDAFVTGFLELKSLSDISDEDAIESYDILYPGTKWPNSYKIRESKSWFNDEYGIGEIKHKWDCMFVADFLRSRGYLVPWMDLSCEEIIEAGWAKLKE